MFLWISHRVLQTKTELLWCDYADLAVCVCVTIQLSLYQVHPGADLLVKELDVVQQVQLALAHRGRVCGGSDLHMWEGLLFDAEVVVHI